VPRRERFTRFLEIGAGGGDGLRRRPPAQLGQGLAGDQDAGFVSAAAILDHNPSARSSGGAARISPSPRRSLEVMYAGQEQVSRKLGQAVVGGRAGRQRVALGGGQYP